MPHVYTGNLLRLDLSSGTQRTEPINEADVRQYLLGSGLAAKIYYEEIQPDLDPLDPGSPLLAFTGLLTGTFSPTGCRRWKAPLSRWRMKSPASER